MSAVARCRSCGAEVVWVVTEKGKKMPLDRDPSPDGRFAKVRVDENGDRLVRFVRDEERIGEKLYQSHFETCPNADRHRR